MRIGSFAIGILVFVAGCSATKTPVYPVQGSVRWKAIVPEGAQVVFHPVGKIDNDTIRPTGQVDRDGKFVLTTFAAGDGAPAGEYEVTLEWWVSPGRDLKAVNKLPDAYRRPETSRLHVTVVQGSNQLQPFELK
jgi:hypothetical protein